MASLVDRLVAEYSSTLDTALIYAIASDCDGSEESEAAAHATLRAVGHAGTSADDDAEKAFREWTLQDVPETHDTLDPISFLKSLFPRRQTVELDLAFQDANEDVEAAIETLLTEDLLIREEEQEYLIPRPGEKTRQKGRHGKPGRQTVNLTSARRGISNAAPDSPTPSPQGTNVWAQTDSTILYLSSLLSVPAGTISSLFYQNGNSLPIAISKLLDKAESNLSTMEDASAKLENLKDLFPDRSPSTLTRCLCATSGDMTKAVELVQTLQEIYAREGTPLAHEMLLSAPNRSVASAAVVHKASATPTPRQKTPSPAVDRPPTAYECASLAWMLRNKRDDAYRSAARTWQSRNALGSSGAAGYWADHGRQLDRQAREWELRAARSMVEDRRKQARSMASIDLHGLTVSQALTITQESLVHWWNSPMGPSTLTIVTGAGKHSAGQNPVLLPAVRKLLEREGYDYKYEGDRWHRGSLTVVGMQGRRKTMAY